MLSQRVVAMFSLLIAFLMVAVAPAQTNVLINYQGRVKVQGQLFNGIGQFKFAITNNAGNVTLWSNDGTSLTGNEPTASLNFSVSEGTFTVLIGDTSLGFDPINSSIFNNSEHLKLRVWFNDGINGFQQLTPDKHILNTDIIGLLSDKNDFTIYVDGVIGNDNNHGLSPTRAKKTIQAAVDIVPPQVRCNITIDVANGIYRESVGVVGISVKEGYFLTILGDESWNLSSVGDPAVRVTGTDNDISHTRVRESVMTVRNCTNVKVKGFLMDYGNSYGFLAQQSFVYLENCSGRYNGNSGGLTFAGNTAGYINNCSASNNDLYGFNFGNFSGPVVTNIKATNNATGVFINRVATVSFYGTGDFSDNTQYGLYVFGTARAQFTPGYTGVINGNDIYGLYVRGQSHTYTHTLNTFSGNGSGVGDNVVTSEGGATY